MLKDMDFNHLQKNIKKPSYLIECQIPSKLLPKKYSIKQVNLQEIKSHNDDTEKQEPVEEIVIPPEKKD